VTEAQARKLALSFPGAEERPHFERVRFKVAGKRGVTFCTLGQGTLNLKIEPRQRLYAFLKEQPDIFIDLGGWTRMGFIGVRLAKVKAPFLRELITDAWTRVASKRERAAFKDRSPGA
jgi:hypothetical protein